MKKTSLHNNKWYQQKEIGSGTTRLLILWKIYRLFNKQILKVILLPIVLCIYIFAKSQRNASKRYIEKLHREQAKRGMPPSAITPLKHFISFAESIVDKVAAYSGTMDATKFRHVPTDDFLLFSELLKSKTGMFLITAHLGSTEILQHFLESSDAQEVKIHAFMQTDQTPIFFDFVKRISKTQKFILHSINDLDISTSVYISDELHNGAIIIIAGDRVSAKYPHNSFKKNFLGEEMEFPTGVFKFAQLMEAPVFFMICVKDAENKYSVHFKAHKLVDCKKKYLDTMQSAYVSFLEEKALEYPMQWYNFF